MNEACCIFFQKKTVSLQLLRRSADGGNVSLMGRIPFFEGEARI
jgi:hypothetical protein